MKRMVCVWLPQWPIERMRRTKTDPPPDLPSADLPPSDDVIPFALTAETQAGLTLTALSAGARAAGLIPGMTLADARARLPALLVRPGEPERDAAALTRLALWSMRFSPFVAVDGADGLLIDMTGAAHLFGGEAAFLGILLQAYARLGLTAEAAIAPTVGAAWALARYGPDDRTARIVTEDSLASALAPLPVAALRLDAPTQILLARFGLKRIDALLGLPRAGLARRFQSAERTGRVLRRLDEALGRLPEPLVPMAPPAPARVRLTLPEPLQTRPALEAALARLAHALADHLAKAHEGAHTLWFSLYRVDGDVVRRRVGLSAPSRDADHFIHLFKEHLDGIDAGFGIDLMTLEAHSPAPLAPGQTALTHPQADEIEDTGRLAVLIDRLTGKLGPGTVARAGLAQSHVPERAGTRLRPLARPTPEPEAPAPTALRPFRLLERPEPIGVLAEVPDGPPLSFTWRRLKRRAVRARGPERIAGEWWQTPGADVPLRDYYEIEDKDGRRYWVFREGLFQDGGHGGPPQWYVHGFFG